MAELFFTQTAVNPIHYFIDFITNNIIKYKLSELTNGHCGDVPSIQDAHPLAIEYGNLLDSDNDNYTSILPAIGIELLDDPPFEKQPLGEARKPIIITQAFVDEVSAIQLKNRYRLGYILSDTVLNDIQAMITAKAGEKLYGIQKLYIQKQMIAISIWSDSQDITGITSQIIRALLKRVKSEISKLGIKNLVVNGQGGLYNHDFHRTLFGYEFTLNFLNTCKNIRVDDSLLEVKVIEEHLDEEGKAGPVFKQIGS